MGLKLPAQYPCGEIRHFQLQIGNELPIGLINLSLNLRITQNRSLSVSVSIVFCTTKPFIDVLSFISAKVHACIFIDTFEQRAEH